MADILGIPALMFTLFLGILLAIVWSLRVLFSMERKLERIEKHIEKMVSSITKKKKR